MSRLYAFRDLLFFPLLALTAIVIGLSVRTARCDGPADNVPDKVRPVPPPGVEIAAKDRAELEKELAALDAQIREFQKLPDPETVRTLPDVQIFSKALHVALEQDEFFAKGDVDKAKKLLAEGRKRAEELAAGKPSWYSATGLVVRGYVSKIDGSVQPYGLVVPATYDARGSKRHPLNVWFHGRGETLSELNFIADRMKGPGEFTPPDTIVLHPYGRYCNAFKFAGEVDVLEGLDSVKKRYRIDPERIAVRGFSMGGAACWHFAVHFASRWVAANPGAGFAETAEFLNVFQSEKVAPTEYETRLWHLYDATDWAENLAQCPTVAYSGEIDKQRQAAEIMTKALHREGMELTHIIGPKTQHKYEPGAKKIVEGMMEKLTAAGRNPYPPEIRFTTYTLKYNDMDWVTVDGLEQHWQRGQVHAKFAGENKLEVKTQNVAGVSLRLPASHARPLPAESGPLTMEIDGQKIVVPQHETDHSWTFQLHKHDGKWEFGPDPDFARRKHHDLQGPIDDAFMDSFIMVRPTGHARQAAVESWAAEELQHATTEWRRQMRGEARVKDDTAITDADIASANLILWGDPESNAILARIADKLPIQWKGDAITVGGQSFPADHHALILICPNPLNPNRYVVLNSGMTFREYDYLSNARQVPKLPDWAVVDLRTPPDKRWPGKIAAADFFDEFWQVAK